MSSGTRSLFLGYEGVRDYDDQLRRGDRVELDADALVRHAFVCGASGAGKTVFAKGIVEEAILAGIPVIAVDFKGDLAAMAITGPLATRDALRAIFGEGGDDAHEEFTEGLRASRAAAERAGTYARKVEPRLFTPDSSAGRRLAMSALPSFPDPVDDPYELEEQQKLTESLVQGFCATMLGATRAKQSMEAATKLVEEIVRWCNERGERLEGAAGIARVLQLVQQPPFATIGGLPVDAYLDPTKYRALITALNSRIVGAERNRYEGTRMSVEALIGDAAPGKVPLAVVYLGHLTAFDDQALVLGQLCADIYRWMRRQGGSRRARLLLYVDELGGADNQAAFYPSYPFNPPSKAPLNLLVKQGRSAGVGVVLATQNPMSVDTRGLGNVNTWAIGRLTQKNDLERVKDPLGSLPQGSQKALQQITKMPTGAFLVRSDAWPSARIVWERWLYSVHRQLTPQHVRVVHDLLTNGPRSEADDARPAARVGQPATVTTDDDPTEDTSDVPAETISGTFETAPVPPAPTSEEKTRTWAAARQVRWELAHGPHRWPVPAVGAKVGRSASADIRLDDPHLSRLHLELVPEGAALLVRTLQAKNPTFVNGRLLQRETRLDEGEHQLVVGSLELALRVRSGSARL